MIAKFDLQVLHRGNLYKIGLREAKKSDRVKFTIGGRSVTPFEYNPLPNDLKDVFSSLNETNFSSEKELMKKLKTFPDLSYLSVTKKVYEVGTLRLLQNVTIESKLGKTSKENAYHLLRCGKNDIDTVIQKLKLPDSVMFEIADRIEKEDNNKLLAHSIREASRVFNLESSINHICDNLLQHCINEESKKMAASIQKKYLNGEYEHIYEKDDLAEALTNDLREIGQNRHVFVMPKTNDGIKSADERKLELEESNFGVNEITITNDRIAYINISSFENPKELVNGKALSREFMMTALKKLVDEKPKALILDLRNHEGGSVFMSELVLSHFIEEAGIPLTAFDYKEPPTEDDLISFPLEPLKTWNYEVLPKDRRLKKTVPLYVLISRDTFSAGEDIACHLKELGRATLIGQTTGGGGDPNKLFDAQEFLVAMPIAYAKVPYGPSWEGVGVKPHIEIDDKQDARNVAEQIIRKNFKI